MLLEDLQWLGLNWDEGPSDASVTGDKGPYGPYKQSQRLSIYKKVAEELLSKGKAYYCFLTDAELTEQREQAKIAGRPPHVQSPYSGWSLEKAQARLQSGDTAVVRFRTDSLKKDFVFTDLVRG